MEERLQKVMAAAGIASRRASEELIRAGRVTVNGQVVAQMGLKVDPARDLICVDGELLPVGAGRLYYVVNKPVGVLSTVSDPFGRRTVVDLVEAPGRVYPVGRLDYDSEGLMLLTNDGELTARLTHARFGHAKTYLALVHGAPSDAALERLLQGIELDDGPARALDVVVVHGVPRSAPGMNLGMPAGHTWLEITLLEGRKHQVRRMLQAIGHPVARLIRIRLGPLSLGELRPGEWRRLTPAEERALARSVARSTVIRKPKEQEQKRAGRRQERPASERTRKGDRRKVESSRHYRH